VVASTKSLVQLNQIISNHSIISPEKNLTLWVVPGFPCGEGFRSHASLSVCSSSP